MCATTKRTKNGRESKNGHLESQHKRLVATTLASRYLINNHQVPNRSSAPQAMRGLRHFFTGPVLVPLQRVHFHVLLPTVLAYVFYCYMFAFEMMLILMLAIVSTCKRSPAYATHVCQEDEEGGEGNRRGWAVGGVRILSIRTLSLRLHRWVWRAWIRFLVMPELRRNPGIQQQSGVTYINSVVLRGMLGAYGGPRLLGDRGAR